MVIYDLFTKFGVTQHTEIDFNLDDVSPAPGAVKKKCHDIRRKIEDELGVVPYADAAACVEHGADAKWLRRIVAAYSFKQPTS